LLSRMGKRGRRGSIRAPSFCERASRLIRIGLQFLRETLAARENDVASRDSILRELVQRHADELQSLRESVATISAELGKLRADAESRFSLRRFLRGRTQ